MTEIDLIELPDTDTISDSATSETPPSTSDTLPPTESSDALLPPADLSGVEVEGEDVAPPLEYIPLGLSSLDIAPRPFLSTPIDDFSVIEGLLLCILFVLTIGLFIRLNGGKKQ